VDTDLSTWSLTPRTTFEAALFGRSVRSTAGIDFYYSDYNSDRKRNPNESPIHRYDAKQTSGALYMQNTVGLAEGTRLLVGGRVQLVRFVAGDVFDAAAPGASGVGVKPLSETNTRYAVNLGLEQRVTEAVELFGRVGRSFRVPTVDERIGTDDNTSFALAIQTAREAELGARLRVGRVSLQSSVFVIETKNEIRFSPELNSGFGANTNFDAIRRIGLENNAVVPLSHDVTLNVNLTVLEAKFTRGKFDGKDVPLVSDIAAGIGLGWRIGRGVRFDALFTYETERWLENDEENRFPKTPATKLLDFKLGGEHGRFNWSAAVNNVLDYEHFNYGVASTSTFGTYNAYPLPGRSFLVRAGLKL
jgi:iron complex outermembrane recepter protein